jgi:hypothetical protein
MSASSECWRWKVSRSIPDFKAALRFSHYDWARVIARNYFRIGQMEAVLLAGR